MRTWMIAGLVWSLSGLAAAAEFEALDRALEEKAVCYWEERPADEVSAGSLGQCDSIVEVLDLTPSETRVREITLIALADFSSNEPLITFIQELPVYAEARDAWSGVGALNGGRHLFIKFVSEEIYTAQDDLYCLSSGDTLSVEGTQLYLSSEPSTNLSADIALPPDLNRRVLESIRRIALDRGFQNGMREMGANDLIDMLNVMLALGVCGRYEGPSFGGDGEDRWEASAPPGARQPLLDARIRIVDDAASLRLFP